MVAWREAKCPVPADDQEWVESSLRWLVDQFGTATLRGTVVLPTDEFFPGAYTGTETDVRRVLDRLCLHLSIDPGRVDLEYVDDADEELLARLPMLAQTFHGSAGEYERRDGRTVVAIRAMQAYQPMALVATIAHELCHERLLGEGRVETDRPDGEKLTDLTTVYFGLGIFAANAAMEFRAREYRWQASRLGYLGQPLFGYALAAYAWLRGEPEPAWARYLDLNPRSYLKRGLRYLYSRP